MAVVNEEAFRVRELDDLGTVVDDARGVVGLILSDREWELAAGVDIAVQDVDEGVAGFLAGEACPNLKHKLVRV